MQENLLELVEESRRLERLRKSLGGKLTETDEARYQFLRKYLAQSLHAGKDSNERRMDFRVPVSLRVRYHTGETFAHNYISNLSGGGVFISTPKPLPLDSKVKLHIIFEDKNVEIDVEGKVVWENTQGGKFSEITKPGMGIKFTNAPKKSQDVIDDIIHSMMVEQARIKQQVEESEKQKQDAEERVKDLTQKPRKK
jgi:type IV pilus assembly protein PilZ